MEYFKFRTGHIEEGLIERRVSSSLFFYFLIISMR